MLSKTLLRFYLLQCLARSLKKSDFSRYRRQNLQKDCRQSRTDFPKLLGEHLGQPSTATRAPTGGLFVPQLTSSVTPAAVYLEGEEKLMASPFNNTSRSWREGTRKRSFNYLLLDPRVTKNLWSKSRDISELECFDYFVRAIFYVGKGQSGRPLSHFNEALRYTQSTSKILPEKVAHIKDIWDSGNGVVNLQCFQNTIPVEAYTREALMISALGLTRLTNQKKGDFYGVCSSWPDSRRQQLGIFLLKKAMKIFLQDGERQIKPTDF